MFKIQNFRRSNWKNYHARKNLRISSWSYDMEGHAKKCVELFCDLANRTTQQLHKISTPCIDDHHFKEEEIRGRIVKSMLSNGSEMLKLGTNWTTWYSHGQWTNLHDRLRNGPEPVTNAWIAWSLTFNTHVNTNSIVMWETLPNNAEWDCSKTLILQKILRIQIYIRWNIAFLEVILDV